MNTAALSGGRRLRPGQSAQLWLVDIATGQSDLLMSSDQQLFESPNWHPSGSWIVVNAGGNLFRLPVDRDGAGMEPILTDGLPELNNDHLISPDGTRHYVSALDGHIWQLHWNGGRAEQVTAAKSPDRQFRHYLHGISPDGECIAYVGTERRGADPAGTRSLWIRNIQTGDDEMLGTGFSPADGPEFSPDGKFVYFNSEFNSTVPGHAQIFRSDLSGGSIVQLSFDERVNWFPHVSPDNAHVAYLSFPVGTVGHPPDESVVIRLFEFTTRQTRDLVNLDGGQGTLNVNSWSPDSTKLAYVAYPFAQ